LFERSDVIVMATGEKDFGDLVQSFGRDKLVVDLVGTWNLTDGANALDNEHYEGIAW
jgi:hypothetical protein